MSADMVNDDLKVYLEELKKSGIYSTIHVPYNPRYGTSYSDRVHSAASVILPLLMERRHEPGYSDDGACHESVRLAMILVDSIFEDPPEIPFRATGKIYQKDEK